MTTQGVEQARRLIGEYSAATLALRQRPGTDEVHAYRIAARRLLALLALWRPLIYMPRLERRLGRAIGRLSALRDAQVHALRFGGDAALLGQQADVVLPELSAELRLWWQRCSEWGEQPMLWRLLAMGLGQRLLELLDDDAPWSLRRWHRLRLLAKEARYGAELMVVAAPLAHGWLAELGEWQELLGQLQDRRQWLRRLPAEGLAADEEAERTARLERQIRERQQALTRRRPVLRELAVAMLQSAPR